MLVGFRDVKYDLKFRALLEQAIAKVLDFRDLMNAGRVVVFVILKNPFREMTNSVGRRSRFPFAARVRHVRVVRRFHPLGEGLFGRLGGDQCHDINVRQRVPMANSLSRLRQRSPALAATSNLRRPNLGRARSPRSRLAMISARTAMRS